MLLEIDDHKTVGDLADRFNKCFPYLRLEFYHHVHKKHTQDDKIQSNELVGNIRKKLETGILPLKSSFTVGKLAQDLKRQFGLHVRILRRHVNEWIPCTEDHITLKELS